MSAGVSLVTPPDPQGKPPAPPAEACGLLEQLQMVLNSAEGSVVDSAAAAASAADAAVVAAAAAAAAAGGSGGLEDSAACQIATESVC